jgi:DNA ligase-associated metallophosphoesterase
MGNDLLIRKLGQNLWLSPQRCIFWENKSILIVSDLHIGKSAHFRKSGIAVPGIIFQEDINRLDTILDHFNPDTLLVTGDFFHSIANQEHQLFSQWRKARKDIRCCMVRGNHEVLSDRAYTELGIEVLGTDYAVGPFYFIHEKPDIVPADSFAFSGHLHPGVRLSGIGKQSISLHCFYFTANQCILPAFSRFTGKHLIDPLVGDEVFAISSGEVNSEIFQIPCK